MAGGRKRVPEFLCPVKYRAGLPDHTTVLPALYPPHLPSLSALLQYRANSLECTSNAILPPFDPFNSSLADFTNLDSFSRMDVKGPEQNMEHIGEYMQASTGGAEMLDVKVEPPQSGKVWRVSKTESRVLLSFDHDPLLTANASLLLTQSDREDIKGIVRQEGKAGEWEARELGEPQHDYYIVEEGTAYPVRLRLQLRRKRQ